MKQDLVLVSTPSGLIAHPPYPERVVFDRETWAKTGGRLVAPNGEPVVYIPVAYNRESASVLAERVVARVEP